MVALLLRYFYHFCSVILWLHGTFKLSAILLKLAAVGDKIWGWNALRICPECVWSDSTQMLLWVKTAFSVLMESRSVALWKNPPKNNWREMPGDCRPPKCCACQKPLTPVAFAVPGHTGQRLLPPFSLWTVQKAHAHTLACIEIVYLLCLQLLLSRKRPDQNPFWIFTMDRRQYTPFLLSPLQTPASSPLRQGRGVANNNVESRLDCSDWDYWLRWFIDQHTLSNVASAMWG